MITSQAPSARLKALDALKDTPEAPWSLLAALALTQDAAPDVAAAAHSLAVRTPKALDVVLEACCSVLEGDPADGLPADVPLGFVADGLRGAVGGGAEGAVVAAAAAEWAPRVLRAGAACLVRLVAPAGERPCALHGDALARPQFHAADVGHLRRAVEAACAGVRCQVLQDIASLLGSDSSTTSPSDVDVGRWAAMLVWDPMPDVMRWACAALVMHVCTTRLPAEALATACLAGLAPCPEPPQHDIPPYAVACPPPLAARTVAAAAQSPQPEATDGTFPDVPLWQTHAEATGEDTPAGLLWWHLRVRSQLVAAAHALSALPVGSLTKPDGLKWVTAVAPLTASMPWHSTLSTGCVPPVMSALARLVGEPPPAATMHDDERLVSWLLPVLLPWCRSRMREWASTMPARFVVAWVVTRVVFPVLSAEVLGHLLPVAFRFTDDPNAVNEWVGASCLAHLLHHSLPTDIRPHTPILSDVFQRVLSSNNATVQAVLLRCVAASAPAMFGPAPHDGYDTALTAYIKKFVLQRSATMQHAFFVGATALVYRMGVHSARHLGALVELVEGGVVEGCHSFVAVEALHCLAAVCVACWPVLRDDAALRDRLTAVVERAVPLVDGMQLPDGDTELWRGSVAAAAAAVGEVVASVA